ncbi:hypothetical protein PHYBLDRAFT_144409 [Phycomyces blakesleeanus NRRL 1555(-)]|uniref:Uncharacterized protein n=1 Tax=Phycomyces blakesleeanus (strain ATCC 8743b / DSM 1359 / FGSC 10004 / NBRC 33097 / NRRL 1555) TaxID=763407 RepID=A0A162XI90_PHYB8|nr:hypothetical protein PHYBLDRAFT_144409 [Phycomyces blakesleeanus NRRL 1555(-)]OAD75055.1 hypothetical protein PHYBLDRAFT_144409 [Phycomyces blakesleeanus NRRL 1555(-)]|eukprot:XP_018293095.1 hypothetical protein PHYBLDRAFT_144409 [Phycomyces blakesleeanus NRRL 1555(-)]
MKHTIVIEAVGKGIHGDAYYVGSCDGHNGQKTDVLYLPHCTLTDDLPPVIVETRQNFDHPFIICGIRYCLDVFEKTHIVPNLVMFNLSIRIISKYYAQVSDQVKAIKDFCDDINLQFGTIIKSTKIITQSSIKQAIKYAEASMQFSKKKCDAYTTMTGVTATLLLSNQPLMKIRVMT